MPSDIKIRSLTGAGIKTYIPSILKVLSEVLKEFPYLILEQELLVKYLKSLSQTKDAIAVLVFDGPKIVGVSTGIPIEEEEAIFQRPFLEINHKLSDYYYFGVSVLLKEHRGRGIAHHFFDIREAHVKHLKRFKKICFTTVDRPLKHPHRPSDYVSLDNFWKKRGYIEHPELTVQLSWREVHEKSPSSKSLHFWIKDL